jgi:hypothetical protein
VTTLADLDPAAVGAKATDLVLQRLARLVVPLSPGVTLTWRADGDSGLALTVADLCAWAQSGALGNWTDHEDAADALQTAAEALFAAPIREWVVSDLDAVDLDREATPGPVALVLACALSRLRICRGESVTVAELARLASVTDGRVRQLVAAGEIAAAAGTSQRTSMVAAVEARRWLASRGLKGWG